MILRNISSNEIDKFSSYIKLTSQGASFKDMLMSFIEKGITKFDWCFVVEDSGSFLGEIVYGVYDGNAEIVNISSQNFDDDVIDLLVNGSLRKIKSEGFSEVECDIYSDKNNFKQYVDALCKRGFHIAQEKKSFVHESDISDSAPLRLSFKSLKEVGSVKYIDVIERVTEGTLDTDDINCIKEYGSKKAAENYFNQLKDIDYNEDWWEIAYTSDNEITGLIIPQKFDDIYGAINYIGVVSEMRGNGYVNDLLKEGIRILKAAKIKKIIADIDAKNFPLDSALRIQKFKLDCNMLLLKYNISDMTVL